MKASSALAEEASCRGPRRCGTNYLMSGRNVLVEYLGLRLCTVTRVISISVAPLGFTLTHGRIFLGRVAGGVEWALLLGGVRVVPQQA